MGFPRSEADTGVNIRCRLFEGEKKRGKKDELLNVRPPWKVKEGAKRCQVQRPNIYQYMYIWLESHEK